MTTTNTTQRPILFSGEMVRAILAGRKTQTRRIIEPQPKPFVAHDAPGPFWWFQSAAKHIPHGRILETELPAILLPHCPYGKPGDLLWVRETWCHATNSNGASYGYHYRADHLGWLNGEPTWKPSIFMPRNACRIKLHITDVRVERVRDISGLDALAEGVETNDETGPAWAEFSKLWDRINGKRGYSWQSNPWVWVIEFERVTQ